MLNYRKIFAQRLKELRASKSLSQNDLATTVNVLRAALGHWENERREPDIQTLCQLADALDVSIDYLVGRSDNPKTN